MIDTVGYIQRLLARYWPLGIFLLALALIAPLWLTLGRGALRGNFTPLMIAALVAAIAATPAWRGAARIAAALRDLGGAPVALGPYAVAHQSIMLDAATPIAADLWSPSHSAATSGAPLSCLDALHDARLPAGLGRAPLVLYAPGWGQTRADNAATATYLASLGYIVLAIDDIAHDAPLANADDEIVRASSIDLSDADATATTRRITDRRVALEAKKAIDALDSLQSCASMASPMWAAGVDFARVGFLGFSHGGAAAAEASLMDTRIAAVINLDGGTFGRAGVERPRPPYMTLLADFDPASARRMRSSRRFEYEIVHQMAAMDAARAQNADTFAFLLRGAQHEALSDRYDEPSNFRKWLMLPPSRARAIKLAYISAFLDAYLRDGDGALLHRADPPYGEIATASEISAAVRNATAP